MAAKGTPVVTSNLGSMAEVVEDRRTGRLVVPGDVTSLAEAIQSLTADSLALRDMRVAARTEFEQKYTAEVNYQILMALYRRALGKQYELPTGLSTNEAIDAEIPVLHVR